MKKIAVFLDRDGTINEEMGYINHVSRFHIFDEAFKALKLFNENQLLSIVVTNQAGLARGYFDESVFKDVKKKLFDAFEENKVFVDGFYFCPHHPNAQVDKFKLDCNCRKPKPGLIEQACSDFDIDLPTSYIIGDRYKDMKFGKKLGVKTVMVLTGYGRGEFENQRSEWDFEPDHICDNIFEAAKWIIKDINS